MFEEKRDERHFVLSRQIPISVTNLVPIGGLVTIGSVESCKQHFGLTGLYAPDDLAKLFLCLPHRMTVKNVIPSQFDDHNSHVAIERPVEPLQSGTRGIARDTYIDHFILVAFIVQSFLQ